MTYLDEIGDAIHDVVQRRRSPTRTRPILFRSYAVLLLAKGEAVTREDVHNAWVAWMASKGEEHGSMVPFAELPAGTQGEDSPFVLAIRRVAQQQRLGGGNPPS